MKHLSSSCLYFGTFNPIHSGHLMIAQAVLSQFSGPLGFKTITFIPANNPPHREQEPDLANVNHRVAMVRLATAANPAFQVSDIELRRPGRSYTMDTITQLLEAGMVKKPVPMIIGSDALAGLPNWHLPRELVEAVRFLQAPRPGYGFVNVVEIEEEAVTLNTCPVDMPLLALSSTWVRMSSKQHAPENVDPLRYLVPEPVRHYIRDNALYRS